MTFVCKHVNNSVHVKFKKTLMYFGKEYLKWLMIRMQELDQEYFILFVMVVQKDLRIRFIKHFRNLIMIGILILEGLLIRLWLLTKGLASGIFCEDMVLNCNIARHILPETLN